MGLLDEFDKSKLTIDDTDSGDGLLDNFEKPTSMSESSPYERVSQPLMTEHEVDMLNKTPEGLSYSELQGQGGVREYLAQRQNETFGKRVANFSKIVPRAATSFLAETAKLVPTLTGAAAWAATGFDKTKFDETVNNAAVKGLTELHENINESLFPVYKRKLVENGGLATQILSPEFWATEAADGVGFLAAFMVPGVALRGLKLGKSTARAFRQFTEKGIAMAGKVDDFAAASINTVAESVAEGIEAYNSTKDQLYSQKVNELVEQGVGSQEAHDRVAQWMDSDEARMIMGTSAANTVKANMAILIAPNMIDQKWLFNSFTRTAKTADKAGSKLLKGIADDSEGFLNSIKKYSTSDKLTKAAKNLTMGVAKEGFFEEGMQFTVSDYFKDKAIDGDSEIKLSEIIEDYASNLTDNVDMQKSVFLGSLLGGGMATRGAWSEANREDKVLFGDKNKKGLVSLLQDNFRTRYKSMDDLRDEKGNLIPEKVARWSNDVIKTFANDELLNTYVSKKDRNSFEFAKYVSDFNYMLPYFEQEGGKELLLSHIDKLAEEDLKYMKETLGVEDVSTQEIKSDLLKKADDFEKIYHRNNTLHKTPNYLDVAKDEEALFNEFNNELVDSKITVSTTLNYLEDKINDVKAKIDEIGDSTSADKVAEKKELESQLTKLEADLAKSNENYKTLNDKKAITEAWEARRKFLAKVKEDLKKESEESKESDKKPEESKDEEESTEEEEDKKEDKEDTSVSFEETETISYEGRDKVEEAIRKAEVEKEQVTSDIKSIRSTVDTLNTVMRGLDNSNVDSLQAEINNLRSLVSSNSKKNSKFGDNISKRINSISEAIRDEMISSTEIANMIRDFNVDINQLTSVAADLDSKIAFYNDLLKDEVFTEDNLYEKLNTLTKARDLAYRLLKKLQSLVKRLTNFLNIKIAFTEKAIEDLENMNFSEMTPEELANAINSGTAEEYASIKKAHDEANKAVNEFIDDVERTDKTIDSTGQKIDILQSKLDIVDAQIRYLEDLLNKPQVRVLPKSFQAAKKQENDLTAKLTELAKKIIRIDAFGLKEKFTNDERKLLKQYDTKINDIANGIFDAYTEQYIKSQESVEDRIKNIKEGSKVKIISSGKRGKVIKVSPNSVTVLVDNKQYIVKKNNIQLDDTKEVPKGNYTINELADIVHLGLVMSVNLNKTDREEINKRLGSPTAYRVITELGILKDGKYTMRGKEALAVLEKEIERLSGDEPVNPTSNFTNKIITLKDKSGKYIRGKVTVVTPIDNNLQALSLDIGNIALYDKRDKSFTFTTEDELNSLLEQMEEELTEEEQEAFNNEANRDENPVTWNVRNLKNTLREVLTSTSNFINDRWTNLKTFAYKADSLKNNPQPIKWNALVNEVDIEGLSMEVYSIDKVTDDKGKEYDRIALVARKGEQYLYLDDKLELQTTQDINVAFDSNTFSTLPEATIVYNEGSDGHGFRFRTPEYEELEVLIKNLTLKERNSKIDFFNQKIKTSAKTVGELADSITAHSSDELMELLYANMVGHDEISEMKKFREILNVGDIIPVKSKTPGIQRVKEMTLNQAKEVVPKYSIFVSEIKEKGLHLGRTYFEDKETGNFYELKTKPLNSIPAGDTNLKNHVLNLFKAFVDSHLFDGEKYHYIENNIYGNKNALSAIGDFVFIQPRQNMTKEGYEKFKAATTTAEKDAIANSSEYLISKNASSNLYIAGGDIVIGGVTHRLLQEVDGKVSMPEETYNALHDFLDTRWMNVSASKLSANAGSYTMVVNSKYEDGKIVVTEDDVIVGNKTATKSAYQDALEQMEVLSTRQFISKDNFTPDRVNAKFIMDVTDIQKSIEITEEFDEFDETGDIEEFDDSFEDEDEDEVMFKDKALLNGKPISHEKATAWLKKTFGDIDVKVVNGLIKKKYLGAATRDAIWLSKEADYGTEYHEAFHRVINYLMTQDEVDAIMSEAKKDSKIQSEVNRIKSLIPNKSEDWYIEEALAESFSNYMLDKELVKHSNKVMEFFSKIYNWIKNFFTKIESDKSLIDNLYEMIDEGKFSNITAREDIDTFSTKPYQLSDEYRGGESFKFTETEHFSNMVSKSIHAITMTVLRSEHSLARLESAFTNARTLSKSLDDVRYIHIPNSLMLPALVRTLAKNKLLKGDAARFSFLSSGILSIFDNDAERRSFQYNMGIFVNKVLLGDTTFDEFSNKLQEEFYMYFDNEKFIQLVDEVLPAMNKYFTKIKNATSKQEGGDIYKIKSYSMILDHWGQTVNNYFNFLNKFNLKVELDEDVYNELEDEDNRRNDTSNYSYLSVQIDGKKSTPRSLKLILSSIKSMTEHSGREVPRRNALGIGETIDFGAVYNILISRLSGVNTEKKFTEILRSITSIPNSGAADILKSIMKPGEEMEDKILLAKFLQNFMKGKNHFLMNAFEDGTSTLVDTRKNIYRKFLTNVWSNNANENYLVNGKYSSKILDGIDNEYSDDNLAKLLKRLGIEFSNEAAYSYDRATLRQIFKYLIVNLRKGNVPDIYSASDDMMIGRQFDNIINIEIATGTLFSENSHNNIDGKSVYDSSLYNYMTTFINELSHVKNRDEFYEVFPHLRNDPYFENSLLFSKLFTDSGLRTEYSFKDFINEGSRIKSTGKAYPYNKFNNHERLFDQFNMYNAKDGLAKYPVIRPGDNKLERFLGLGKFISKGKPVNEGKSLEEIIYGYIHDELNFIIQNKNSEDKFTNISNVYKKSDKFQPRGIVLDLISMYSSDSNNFVSTTDIITDTKKSVDTIVENLTEDTVDTYTKELYDNYFDIIKRYFSEQTEELYTAMKQGNMISVSGKTVTLNGIRIIDENANVINETTEDNFKSELNDFFINSWIANNEQFKMLFAHPVQYKALIDVFKRITGAVGTKKIQIIDGQVDEYIRTKMTRMDKFDSISKNGKDRVMRVGVVNDVVAVSKYIAEYGLDEMDETDGFSFISMDEHRELLFRTGDWGNSMEDIYQYERARFEKWLELQQEIQNRELSEDKETYDELIAALKEDIRDFTFENPYTGNVITAEDFAKNNATSLPSLKFQGYGPYAGLDNTKQGMIKTSGGLLLPSMAIDYETSEVIRPNLLSLIDLMRSDKVKMGILMFKSANKGVTSKLNAEGGFTNPYKEASREFNLTADNVPIMEFNRKYLGIQLDTGFHIHKKVVFGTQMGKQILFAAFENGDIRPERESDREAIEDYLELNKERIDLGYKNLINDLGIEPVDGGYILPAGKKLDKLIDRLQQEVKTRDLPQNMLDTLELLSNNPEAKTASALGVDTFINRETIENILYSIAESSTNKQMFNGSAKYQVPSTFFETKDFLDKEIKYVEDKNGKKYLASNNLKFYTKGENGTGAMEVYIPSYFEGLVNPGDELDERLREIVGFRIPTQGPVSIDAIVIKGFLPPQAGDIIVLPTEIVKKAGSDYDIDKMQLYMPNYIKTLEGDIKYIDKSISHPQYVKEMSRVIVNRYRKSLFKSYEDDEGNFVNYSRKTRNILEVIVNDSLKEKDNIHELISKGLNEAIDREQNSEIEAELIIAKNNLKVVEQSITDKIENKNEYRILQIQNEMINRFREIMLAPHNYEMMTGSIDSNLFDDYATLVQLKEQNPNEDLSKVAEDVENGMTIEDALAKHPKKLSLSKNVGLHNLANRMYLNDIAKQNMDGAGAVGMSALASTFHIISTMENFRITKSQIPIRIGDDNDFYSTAINLSHNKIGDAFTPDLSEKNVFSVTPKQSVDKKAKAKAKVATKYIGFADGISGSSTALYAAQAGEYANTGTYTKDDVVFVSIGGKRGDAKLRKEQQDRTISEVKKAISAGATVLTDNQEYTNKSTYNEGEKRLLDWLLRNNVHYSEKVIDGHTVGVWNTKSSFESGISLSNQLDANNKNRIGTILSLFVNAAVDNAKDPKLGKLNMTPATLNVALYLTVAGVPFSEISLFMSQPIVKEYIDIQARNESFFVEEMGLGLGKKKMLQNLIKKYDRNSTINRALKNSEEFTTSDLMGMVGTGTKYGEKQAKILGDFIRYQESAKKFSNAVQAISYDTNGFGKNTAETLLRQSFTKHVLADDFVNGLSNTLDDGYLSPYYKSVENVIGDYSTQGVYAPLLYPLASQKVKDEVEKILIGDENNPGFITSGVPRGETVKILDMWFKDLITYSAVNKPNYLPADIEEKTINKLKELKENQKNTLIQSILINKLTIVPDNLNTHGHKGIIFNSKNLDRIDSDIITNDWISLYKEDSNKEFAINLAKFVILQTGLQSAPNGYRQFIPAAIWNDLMKDAVADIRADNVDFNRFNVMFALNNYSNNNIVPKDTKKSTPNWYVPLMKSYVIKDKVNDKAIFHTRPKLVLKTELDRYVVSEAKTGDMDFYYDPFNDQVRTAYGSKEGNELADKILARFNEEDVVFENSVDNFSDRWNDYSEAMESNNKVTNISAEEFANLPLDIQNTMIEQAKNC